MISIPAISQLKNKGGVYKITSKINPIRVYVGSSLNLYSRVLAHSSELNKNKHANSKLQNHFNKYPDDLVFNLIGFCPKENLLELEQLVLDEYKDSSEYDVFNLCPVAGSRLGSVMSKESKDKLSKYRKGKKFGLRPEHSKRMLGNNFSKGFKWSEESKIKMSQQRKGRPNKFKGTLRSEEHKLASIIGMQKLPAEKKILIKKMAEIARKKAAQANMKPIIQIDFYDNEIERFCSMTEASNKTEIPRGSIRKCLNGGILRNHNFTFKYL